MAETGIDHPHPTFVRAKTEKVQPPSVFTGERDERLDPLRGRLAFGLTLLLFFALLLHAGLMFWASYGTPDAAKNVSAVFNIWIPILSGLTSSAITWFFTRQK